VSPMKSMASLGSPVWARTHSSSHNREHGGSQCRRRLEVRSSVEDEPPNDRGALGDLAFVSLPPPSLDSLAHDQRQHPQRGSRRRAPRSPARARDGRAPSRARSRPELVVGIAYLSSPIRFRRNAPEPAPLSAAR
jgi:hypothetical protein